MSSDYTGSATSSQSPGPAPGVGVAPIIRLPVDGEAANVASIYQELKQLADFVAFLTSRPVPGPYGDGSDGDLHVTGTTHLTGGAKNYRSITIDAAASLIVDDPLLIRVQKKLTIAATGHLRFGDPADIVGGDASNVANGVGGVGWNNSVTGQVLGGAGGSSGLAIAGIPVVDSLGGAGGAGGTGSGGLPGGAGGGHSAIVTLSTQDRLALVMAGGWGFKRGGAGDARTAEAFGIQGGSGGGSGSHGSFTGGGGAGGAVGLLYAREIEVNADGAITCLGGNGGAGFAPAPGANGGGGGAGGGGYLAMVCSSFTGTAQTAAVCCAGGTGGASGAPDGADGDVGNLDLFVIAES